jgi:steroid delta-isomerase-like uncharacterized protein
MNPKYPTLVHEWFEEVWNQGRIDAIHRLLSPDCFAHGLEDESGNKRRGPDGFLPVFHQFRSAFPDIRIEVQDAVCQDHKIAARCIVRGTHHGSTLGSPTGKKIFITGMVFVHTRDGQIVESWNNFDFQALFKQIQADVK